MTQIKIEQAKHTRRRRVRRQKPEVIVLTKDSLLADIMQEARVLGLEPGAARLFADKVAGKVISWAKKRSAVTLDDLNRKVGEELEPYNFDLAYIFKNRDKII